MLTSAYGICHLIWNSVDNTIEKQIISDKIMSSSDHNEMKKVKRKNYISMFSMLNRKTKIDIIST